MFPKYHNCYHFSNPATTLPSIFFNGKLFLIEKYNRCTEVDDELRGDIEELRVFVVKSQQWNKIGFNHIDLTQRTTNCERFVITTQIPQQILFFFANKKLRSV